MREGYKRGKRWSSVSAALALCVAVSGPARGAEPGGDYEAKLAEADEHTTGGRHAEALRAYAESLEVMPAELRVTGVAEFAVLAAGRAAIADYQERGQKESLEQGREILLAFIEGIRAASTQTDMTTENAEARLAEIEALMPEEDEEPVTEAAPKPVPEESMSEPEQDVGGKERPGKLKGLGKAGIGLLVVGGLTSVAGIILVARPPQTFPTGDVNADKVESTRLSGGILLGGGVALVITGAVLLGVDRKRAKKDRSTAMVHPWMGAHGGGLGIRGRF